MSKKSRTIKERDVTPLAKAVIDNYFANGCESVAAYCKAKKIKEPKDLKKRKMIANRVQRMLKDWQGYVEKVEKKNEKKVEKVKDKLIDKLDNVTDAYFRLLGLAEKDSLTDEEKDLFNRLRSVVGARDFTKSVDLIAKMTGSFEAEKHEVTTKFTVRFGGNQLNDEEDEE